MRERDKERKNWRKKQIKTKTEQRYREDMLVPRIFTLFGGERGGGSSLNFGRFLSWCGRSCIREMNVHVQGLSAQESHASKGEDWCCAPTRLHAPWTDWRGGGGGGCQGGDHSTWLLMVGRRCKLAVCAHKQFYIVLSTKSMESHCITENATRASRLPWQRQRA